MIKASLNPPIISVACLNNSKAAKDTARNIKSTKGFTVNIISEPWIEQANFASIDAPYGVSEWPLTGLTKAPSVCFAFGYVNAPFILNSLVSLRCR